MASDRDDCNFYFNIIQKNSHFKSVQISLENLVKFYSFRAFLLSWACLGQRSSGGHLDLDSVFDPVASAIVVLGYLDVLQMENSCPRNLGERKVEPLSGC